jgi:hypothetical protein
MGRPRKDPGEGREVSVSTRVKVTARARIDALAAGQGITRSEWCRRVLGQAITDQEIEPAP